MRKTQIDLQSFLDSIDKKTISITEYCKEKEQKRDNLINHFADIFSNQLDQQKSKSNNI